MNGARSFFQQRAFWVLMLVCVPAVTGCYTISTELVDQALPNLEDPAGAPPVPPAIAPPRELAKMSLPDYRLEPPDEIQIEMLKTIPLPPYRLGIYDFVSIDVRGTLLDAPITSDPKQGGGPRQIDTDGTLDLKAPYGKVRIAGMTIDEATKTITSHLKEMLKYPEVSLRLAQGSPVQPVSGMYRIGPDGTINLRAYGSVRLAGMTVVETKRALETHLAQYFDSPQVSVTVVGYNSKVYYIITEGAGQGDKVVRLQITGNETVLDAISQIGGLSQSSSTDIWIARPAPAHFGCEQIIPIDWEAITRGGMTGTNYQILPGDRVYIAEDEAVAWSAFIAKVTGPVEQILGVGMRATSAFRNFQSLGEPYQGGGGYGGFGSFGGW